MKNVELTEEQRSVKASAYEKDVVFILGDFGTGKTLVACQIALGMLLKHQVDKILISRPLNFDATGYLKGNMDDKMALHILPLKQNFYMSCGKEKTDALFRDGSIQIVPIDYMKGMTFTDAVVIVDEFEDITYDEWRLIMTRLGKGSKLLFTGSREQTQKDMRFSSCLIRLKALEDCPLVAWHVLTCNHRNENVQQILDYIER